MKKQFAAILFLFVLFAPVVSMFVYLHYQKAAVKREIKWKMIAGIDQEELVLLKFTKEETKTKLRWEHSKEFEYNKQMYDIVSTQIKGDTIIYRCWWDHEETKLNKKLQKLVVKAFDKNEDKQKHQKDLQHYFQSFFCSELFNWQSLTSEEIQKPQVDYMTIYPFKNLRFTPPTPPPKYS